MLKNCKDCLIAFFPKEIYHKLCDDCSSFKFKGDNICSKCNGKIKGYYDDYFIMGCHCSELRDLECDIWDEDYS